MMGLVEHRMEVQKVDEEILRLIQKRMALAEEIYRDKAALGLSISDPEQEALVLSRAVDMATELGLDPGSIKSIFRILIDMSLQRQHGLRGEDNLP
ncbi:MAG: chorismate mutase [Methanothrix sp.]|nr:chorismate mutase [Methanothrix sp.]MCX8206405.1 chorismate mutase [Methanothrix sp.]